MEIEVFTTFLNEIRSEARKAAEETARAILSEHQTPEPQQDKGYISGKELAERLGVSLQSIIRYRNEGRIPAHRIGGRVLYSFSEVEKALKPTRR